MKNKQSFEDLKYYSACCRCQYYIDKKCTNKHECIWLDIEKDLKILGIIIKKRVNLDYLRGCKTLEDYNNILIEKWQLTENEFNLIKERLTQK